MTATEQYFGCVRELISKFRENVWSCPEEAQRASRLFLEAIEEGILTTHEICEWVKLIYAELGFLKED